MSKNSVLPLPLFKSLTGDRFKFSACFNGSHVIIDDQISILNLNCNGCFGKSSIERNKQMIRLNADDIVSDEVEESKQLHNTEHLLLLHEEAFFLMQINCLSLKDLKNTLLDTKQAWMLFNEANPLFLQNYIIYHYYRSKNWIVKAGLKYSADFTIYRDSPEVCHSSYIVIIDTQEKTMGMQFQPRRMTAASRLLGIQRLAESAGKEVLMARIVWKGDVTFNTQIFNDPTCIQNFEVQEILLNRIQNKTDI